MCAFIVCPALVIADLPIDDIESLFGISTVSGRSVVITFVLVGRSLARRIESVAPLSTMGLFGVRFALLGGVVGDAKLWELFILPLYATLTDLVASLVLMPTPPRQTLRNPGVVVVFPSFPLILTGRVAFICSGV